MKKLLTLLSLLMLVAVVFVQVLPVAAYTDVSSYSASCSGFSASGTTNAPYVVVYVEAWTGSGWDEYYEVFPNSTGAYSHSISIPEYPAGTDMYYYTWGSLTNDSSWDGEDWFEIELACVPILPGPGIPNGFVLRTITCDVAVYDAPAGNAVGEARIRAGQTWYVSPTTSAGSADWTEIFVGGFTNGYIPTACVN